MNTVSFRRLITALTLAAGTTAFAQAEEAAPDPHALHETNCIKCHGSEVYTRDERKVTSLDGLGRQVRQCETALGLRWFDDEIADVTTYLNDSFYRFKPD